MTQNQASSAQTPNKATGQNPTGTQPPSQKDWNTLQQEQTKNIRDLIAQMNQPKPKQQKKKKKKAKKDPNVASPAKPGNASNQQQQQKKPQNDQANVRGNNNNTPQKSTNNNNQSNSTNEVQNQTKPPQARQSTKKPKPQYKIKENPEVESTPSTSATKRQNLRQPKVWKRKDENLDEEEENLNEDN